MGCAWRVLFAGALDAGRSVFVNEKGANVPLSPTYAWSRRGLRAHAKAPRNRGRNATLLASISAEGVGPCPAVEGPATREIFEAYPERVVAPSLRPGRVVVPGHLSAHKGGRVGEIVGGAGCGLAYLPPHSPDLDPIEQAFSSVGGLLRRAESHAREALIEAMGQALDAITARYARGFLGHCGYRTMGQLL